MSRLRIVPSSISLPIESVTDPPQPPAEHEHRHEAQQHGPEAQPEPQLRRKKNQKQKQPNPATATPLFLAMIVITYVLVSENSVASLLPTMMAISPVNTLTAFPTTPQPAKRPNWARPIPNQLRVNKIIALTNETVVVRLIRDDAPPLRRHGHSERQLRFLLNHPENTALHFRLVRLYNSTNERRILDLLLRYGVSFSVVHFEDVENFENAMDLVAFLKGRHYFARSVKFVVVSELDTFFPEKALQQIVQQAKSVNKNKIGRNSLFEIPFMKSVHKRHEALSVTLPDKDETDHWDTSLGLNAKVPSLYNMINTRTNASSSTRKKLGWCVHMPSVHPSHKKKKSLRRNLARSLNESLNYISSHTLSRKARASPYSLLMYSEQALYDSLHNFARRQAPHTIKSVNILIVEADAVLLSVKQSPHRVTNTGQTGLLLAMAWCFSSNHGYARTSLSLLKQLQFRFVGEMGYCEAIEAFKLLKRTGVTPDIPLYMKTMAFDCNSEVISCICKWSLTSEITSLYRFSMNFTPSSNLTHDVKIATMLSNAGFNTPFMELLPNLSHRLHTHFQSDDGDDAQQAEEILCLFRQARQACGQGDSYVKEWEAIENSYGSKIDAMGGLFGSSGLFQGEWPGWIFGVRVVRTVDFGDQPVSLVDGRIDIEDELEDEVEGNADVEGPGKNEGGEEEEE